MPKSEKSDYKANATANQSEVQARRSTLRANPRRTVDPLKEGLEESYVKFFKPNRSMDARAKKRARAKHSEGSKSEPPNKRPRLNRANQSETVVKIENSGEKHTPRPSQATRKDAKSKKGLTKLETPAVKREEKSEDEASATPRPIDRRTKRRADPHLTIDPLKEGMNESVAEYFPHNQATDTTSLAMYKRSIPIERLPAQAEDQAFGTQAKINVTVLLVDSKMGGGGDRPREQWLPAAKKTFLKSLGDIGREQLILDVDTPKYDLLDLFAFTHNTTHSGTQQPVDEAVASAMEIVDQVKQLGDAFPLSKVVLIGWGLACLSILCALPYVSHKLACIVNIAFHESEFENFDEGSMDIISGYNVPMLFVVGGGDEKGCEEGKPVDFVNNLQASLRVPTGIYIVEKASEELLVPARVLRKSATDQRLVNERIKYHIADFIKQALELRRKTRRKA